MKHALKSIKGGHQSSARVVDGKLILSFPDALTPVVWQMDLGEVSVSSLEVQESKEGETYTLVMKTPKGDDVEVAPFSARNKAVSALMAASGALENAQGQIQPMASISPGGVQAAVVPAKKSFSFGKFIGIVLGLFLIFVLFGVWASMTPRVAGTGTGSTSAASSPQDSAGVPLSADEFLRGQ